MLKKSNSEKYRGKQEGTELEIKYLEKCEFRIWRRRYYRNWRQSVL